MPECPLICHSDSPDRTCTIAARLAPRLRAGDVMLLAGDVGAGKTHFARCVIRALLKVSEDVPSPTYTLVQTYAGQDADIWHADLYRLTGPDEVIELGLSEAFGQAICLVEWPDRLAGLAPETALTLTLCDGGTPEARRLRFDWTAPHWANRLEALCDD